MVLSLYLANTIHHELLCTILYPPVTARAQTYTHPHTHVLQSTKTKTKTSKKDMSKWGFQKLSKHINTNICSQSLANQDHKLLFNKNYRLSELLWQYLPTCNFQWLAWSELFCLKLWKMYVGMSSARIKVAAGHILENKGRTGVVTYLASTLTNL